MLSPTAPLVDVLEQLASAIRPLTPAQYARRPHSHAGGSIGAQVRHCLDHVAALLNAGESGRLDYDQRQRGTPVEADAGVALETIRTLQRRLDALPPGRLDRAVTVRALLSPGAPPLELPSSLARELAYVVSHTTHHNAIIGFMVRAEGGATPERFGYAASTLAWLQEAGCAR
jgi:uncharacterized damage-inducible protein DinB